MALQNLPVIFCLDRGGLVGEDGETHHGVFDIGFLRQAPGMQILCPASCAELSDMLKWAAYDMEGPVAIRYPRGGDGNLTESYWDPQTSVVCHRSGKDLAIVTYGTMTNQALEAAQMLASENVDVAVIRLLRVHPLPASALESALGGYRKVVVVEETCTGAGIGEAVSHCLCERVQRCDVVLMDLGREYVTHGSVKQLYEKHGLDAVSIAKKVREVLARES